MSLARRLRERNKRLLPTGVNLGHLDWTGVFTAIGAIGTFAAAGVAAYQLQDANHNIRVDRANNALQQFLYSDQMVKITDEIAAKTAYGTDYTAAGTDRDLRRRLAQYMNGLEIIALGVNLCTYDERVIHSMLASNVFKHVNAQLAGRPGKFGTSEWKTNGPVFDKSSYAEMRRLYKRWFPDDVYTVKPPREAPNCKELV